MPALHQNAKRQLRELGVGVDIRSRTIIDGDDPISATQTCAMRRHVGQYRDDANAGSRSIRSPLF